ncbi:EAL domain-containing protein [Massilia dura]|uniref:EAL domain-containing protein n=1 Tax=Pseudoduganella dura TaxID=321982 RepID=A0A6I3X5N6_9BURK|nr:EAL domain-containing protein [Pseudoduganella dura]MUI11096.1 EAL domain-containing protein [Pseudoduganella dura]GGY03411.1 sensor domain-containing phosphodiesterase [Pseudoduganella dura]
MDTRIEGNESEQRRVQELSRYELALDKPDPQLRFIVELAVQTMGADIGGISLVYHSHIWLPVTVGIALREIPRDESFCSDLVACESDFSEVEDALVEDWSAAKPIVRRAPHYRHYAGVALYGNRGYQLGTLWVMWLQPGQVDAAQRTMLQGLARLVTDTLELRYCDAVTGMYNRGAFVQHLQHAKGEAGRRELTVGYIDLTGFHQINEVYGRGAGDATLAEIAARVVGWAGADSLVAHLGGDRFAFALLGLSGMDRLQALCHAIDVPVTLPSDRTQALHARIGIVRERLPSPVAAAALLDMAETAAASIGDMASFSVIREYGSEMRERSGFLHDLLGVLEGQPEAGRLSMHYQPQVNFAKQNLIGLEALVRWEHPQRGTVSPSVFVPLAESSGNSYALDMLVMGQVCRDMRGWMDAGLPQVPVSLNFSRSSLLHPGLPEEIKALMAQYRLPGALLEVEVTESQLLEAPEALGERVAALRDLGLRIAIDDFGIGYSNLDAIGSLPFDRLKVDRRFVHGVADSAVTASLFRLIQGVAEVSDAELLCEGLERQVDLDWLRHEHAYCVQGWYFCSALPPRGVEDLLRAWGQRTRQPALHGDVRELFASS